MNTQTNVLSGGTTQRLPVSTSEGLYFFDSDEIIRLEASSNYTYIYFTNRKPMLIAKVLGDYETMLASLGFVRTHRSHLINKKHILFIDVKGDIVMQDTSRAEISRRKRKDVMRELKQCFFQNKLAA